MNLLILNTSDKWNQLAYFQVHSSYSTRQCFISFCGWVMFCCIALLHSTFSYSIHQLMDIWAISTLRLLWMMLLWTYAHVFVWTYAFISFAYISRRETAKSYVKHILNILRNFQTFPNWAAPFYNSNSNVGGSLISSSPYQRLSLFVFCYYCSYSSEYKVCLWFSFSNGLQRCSTSFHMLTGLFSVCLFWRNVISNQSLWLMEVWYFLLLSCKN